MEISRISPPERDFYTKYLDVFGTVVKAHDDVSDEAVLVAGRRITRLLEAAPAVAANLASAGAELHVIGQRQRVTDLPMYRHMAGVPRKDGKTMDERARGYGGLHCCCAEESLLGLPSSRHRDHRDICSHEFAHTIHSYGLGVKLRERIEERYERARHLWRSAYAASNEREFFAELTMWYVGSRGDYRSLPSPRPGPEWLARHDPESYALLDGIYTGRLAPEPIVWDRLQPSDATRSASANVRVSMLFANETERTLERFWLDYKGERRPYGPIGPWAAVGQSTFATHPWLLTNEDGEDVGVFVPGETSHALVRIT